MGTTIREPEKLFLAIDRIHGRWFDVGAIKYDPHTRAVTIPFWNTAASKPPLNRATGEQQPFDAFLTIYDADPPTIEDKEDVGSYTFNGIAYSSGQVAITADPNLRIGCSVRSLHVELGPDAFDRLAAKLTSYPDVQTSRSPNSISIQPPTRAGFPIDLQVYADHCTVYFDRGWHEDFDSEQEALNCIAFGLSSSCRLAVTYRGSTPCRWAVQSRQGIDWQTDSVTGLLIFPFWRRPHVVFKQNDLVKPASQEAAK